MAEANPNRPQEGMLALTPQTLTSTPSSPSWTKRKCGLIPALNR